MAAEPAIEPDDSSCPSCGRPRGPDATDGLCPECRLEGAGDLARLANMLASTRAGQVLTTLEAEVGRVPRIHLAETADGLDRSSTGMPPIADRSGRFQLLGEIARGGMGVVLKGRDPDLGRELAVKVLLDANREKPDLVRRFVEEAQIGGQLQHPGVIPVYELGSFGDRRPYFTMKLVKGQTLAELLADRGSPSVGQARFLSIFESICQTMAYAHARGVIHRDLKPSNIMVGSFGEVQVMDWGLAKVLSRGGAGLAPADDTVVTTARPESGPDLSQAGSVLGTPAYMAPEQARGDVGRVDERADVFALGSILCEILTGRPAFTGRSASEIRRKAAHSDLAEAVAALEGSGADGALIALAVDCLAPEPEGRPPHAGAAADRIVAYHAELRERLVAAQVARAAEEARAEESRRTAEAAEARTRAERRARRLSVALATALMAAALLGGAGWRWVELQRLERVRESGAKATAALHEAARLRGLAQGAAAGDLTPWAEASAAADKARDLLAPGVEPALRDQVEALASAVAAERERAAADADAARRDRELLERLMDVRAAKSEMTSLAAAAAYAEAFRRSDLDPEAPSFSEAAGWIRERPRDVAVSLAAALDDWAWVRRQDIKDQAGAAPLTALARAVDPDPWRNQLRDAVESQDPAARLAALRMLAESASYETLGPVSLDMLGTALGLAGDHPAAEAVLRRAQLRYPGDVWINLDLASTLEKLVRREEAIRYYIAARSIRPESAHELAHALEKKGEHDEAVAVFRELARRRPGDGRHLACFGQLLNERGRKEEARSVLVASAAATREQIRQEPNNATLRSALAQALALQGKFDEAAVEIREAVRLGPDKAGLHYNLSNLLIDQKKPDEALVAIREALRLKPDNVEFLTKLGNILADFKRDYAAAEAAFRDALRLDPDDPVAHHGLGVVLHNVGRLEESTAEFREAVRRRPDDAASRGYLGDLLLKFKRDYAAAAAEFREALRLKPDAADARHGLVVALENLGKLDEASAELREAVRLRPDVVALRNHLGKLLARQGKADDAIAAIREALRLSPDSAEAHTCLGEVLVDLKQEYAAAEAEFREALRLKPAAAEAHHGLGVVLARQGKADDAIAAIRESIRLHPGEANAHANLGSILGDVKRDYAAAEAEFREALRLGPDSAGNRVSLGNILAFQGKTDEAIAELREAIRLGPGDAEVHVRLGDVLGDLKHDYAAAAAAYREAIRLKPDAVESHHGLGVALFKLGKSDEAIAELREALRLRPDNTVSHSTLGLLLEALKKPDEAITEFREAIRLDPDNLKAAVGLVRVLTASRKAPDQIIDALRGAVRLLPDDAGMRNHLAWLLALSPGRPKADYEDALRHARKAVELKPKEYSLANTLALAEYRVGDWERCIAAAERSMTLGAGGGADDRFFLAMARWRKGDKDEARKRFDEGVAMTKKASPPNSEHLQFWKEAAELLGAPGPDAPEPAKTGDGEAASG